MILGEGHEQILHFWNILGDHVKDRLKNKTRHLNVCSRLWGLSRQGCYTTTNMEDAVTRKHVGNSCYKLVYNPAVAESAARPHLVVRRLAWRQHHLTQVEGTLVSVPITHTLQMSGTSPRLFFLWLWWVSYRWKFPQSHAWAWLVSASSPQNLEGHLNSPLYYRGHGNGCGLRTMCMKTWAKVQSFHAVSRLVIKIAHVALSRSTSDPSFWLYMETYCTEQGDLARPV